MTASVSTTSTHTAAAGADEPRMGEVLDSYLAALEKGQAPPIEQVLAEHQELRVSLEPALRKLRELHRVALGIDRDATVPQSIGHGVLEGGVLGDFRILREIGRGGMGVVYEAEQISLARRVALKILPFAAMLDPRHLQRFKNEALAAAHLAHPNIVDVYGVGCERGVHFYAMRLIEGNTLAAVISECCDSSQLSISNDGGDKPDSAFRENQSDDKLSHSRDTIAAAFSTLRTERPRDFFRRVAELGIQAAEALDHAHQMGIVHRDIKPSNLIIDHLGKLWITDFGLARFQNEPGMTMTGDLIGTLRYMSPEQALAKRITVDHRADIYSLGVTFYELITQRPVFPGDDRETLLRHIAFDEPTPPRKFNPAIPAELETILHKAISKNPDDRYATARELADDLQRFLDQKPITAKPPTLWQLTVKWSRRHMPIVWSTIVCLVVTLVAVAGSIGWIMRERSERLSTVRQAQMHYDRGLVLRSESRFAEAAIEFQAAIRLWQGDEQARPRLYTAYWSLADALGEQPDQLAEAWAAGQEANRFLRELVEESPGNVAYIANLSINYSNAGNGNWIDWRRYAAAIECWETSLKIGREAMSKAQGSRVTIADRASVPRWQLCFAYATCPEKALRRPERALFLAEEQDREAPGTEAALMLSVAHVANGQWQLALDDVAHIDVRREKKFVRLILMAIANDRLGNHADSEECYRQAATWLNEYRTQVNRDKFDQEFVDRMQHFYDELVTQRDKAPENVFAPSTRR